MKRGDVFQVGDGEPLYYADAIAPNGNVYALPYDRETGTGKKLTIFKSDVEFQVLFNNRITPPQPPGPEPLKFEAGWDYCEIIRKSETVAPHSSEICWVAQTIASDTSTVLGKSACLEWYARDGHYTGEVSKETSVQWRRELVTDLVGQGWHVIDEAVDKVTLKRHG